MNPILSIIIPCYNSALTLADTLMSVKNQNFENWEALIINDGSIDKTEEIALNWADGDRRFLYYSKENGGLGKARNYGIERAKGIYILPLDSDNLLEKSFASDALTIFNNNSDVGIVYGDAVLFGEKEGLWKMDEFKLHKMLVENYIDACAIYKKQHWQTVGGYDENMPYQGHEDWDFWIACGVENVSFHYLDKVTFRYYVSSNSMIRTFSSEMFEANRDYIVKKYSKKYFFEFSKALLKSETAERECFEKLNSEKFIINFITKKIFGFKFFKV